MSARQMEEIKEWLTHVSDLQALFESLDANGDGLLSANELHQLTNMGVLSPRTCAALLTMADTDGDGLLSLNELAMLGHALQENHALRVELGVPHGEHQPGPRVQAARKSQPYEIVAGRKLSPSEVEQHHHEHLLDARRGQQERQKAEERAAMARKRSADKRRQLEASRAELLRLKGMHTHAAAFEMAAGATADDEHRPHPVAPTSRHHLGIRIGHRVVSQPSAAATRRAAGPHLHTR